MEKQKKLLREVINLFIRFFKPYKVPDEMLAIPKNVKKMGFKVNLMQFGMTVLAMTFAFMLKATNVMIEYKFILLGIILFMLYRGQRIAKDAYAMFRNSEDKKFQLIFDDEIVLRGSRIIGRTADKVLRYDYTNKLYKIMSNEAALNTIKRYLSNAWELKFQHWFDVCELFSVIVMLIVAIITNTSIKQVIFIPLIIIFVLISFFSTAFINMNRDAYNMKNREYDNMQHLIANDLLRVPTIVESDLTMRISKFQKSVLESNENIINFHRKMNLSGFFISTLEVFSQYGIIIFYLLGVEWSSISLATITEITATLVIVETALGQIKHIVSTLDKHNEKVLILEREESDISLILDVYHAETAKLTEPKVIDNIDLKPFSIRYKEESENDKPFTLESKDPIHIGSGDIAILYGPSGSGKSTFMKMLTERIQLEKSTDIPSTSRFLFYDEKLRFGSLSIYEELFCCSENPNLTKMQAILENLHLWYEIESNCFDVWQWMKEKKFNYSLSNGQKQRLILAKMLYWLNDDIDVLVLDECTSGLDDKSEYDSADAERILEYIVRYANKDRKRIVIISTHQNIDGFKQKLASEYTFKNFIFIKEGECNLIKKI